MQWKSVGYVMIANDDAYCVNENCTQEQAAVAGCHKSSNQSSDFMQRREFLD